MLDRDRVYRCEFRQRIQSLDIEDVLSAPASPRQRAYVERLIESFVMDNKRSDQPLHKGTGQRNVGHGLDLSHIQDSQIGLPLMKAIKRIVVGTEVFRHGGVAAKGVVEHSAKGDAVDGAGLRAKPNDPTSVLIHDHQYSVSP